MLFLRNENLELDSSCVGMASFAVVFCHADEGGIYLNKRY